MLKFNNNHIFTGYLKQLLSEFNLPTCRVYTNEQYRYARKTRGKEELNVLTSVHRDLDEKKTDNLPLGIVPNHVRYIPYIKDTEFQEYVLDPNTGEAKWKRINGEFNYYYNRKLPQFTKNLIIKNNIYDSYTHEYLGNFLRFQRDYHNINLMSMYNCFSNRICNNIYISMDKVSNNDKAYKTTFDSKDAHYKIYMVPVKFFQKYTIAIDSELPIEMCCSLYGKYHYTNAEKLKNLQDKTYCKLSSTVFSQPFIYDKLANITANEIVNSDIELATKEDDLKLFIKIPFSNTSSIVILEGDYVGYNDRLLTQKTTTPCGYWKPTGGNVSDPNNFEVTEEVTQNSGWKLLVNHSVVNFEESTKLPPIENRIFDPITNLQLLQLNTGISYPFADRLIEYLLGNVITEVDKIDDNIARVQKVMGLNYIESTYPGVWEKKIRMVMYEFMNRNRNTRRFEINHDLLGYVDKDVEKFYYGYDRSGRETKKVTISSVDLYPEMYNSDKKERR